MKKITMPEFVMNPPQKGEKASPAKQIIVNPETQEREEREMRMSDVLMSYLMRATEKSKEDVDLAFSAWKIAQKAGVMNGTLELEDSEYDDLKRIIRECKEPLYTNALVIGQLWGCIKDAK